MTLYLLLQEADHMDAMYYLFSREGITFALARVRL